MSGLDDYPIDPNVSLPSKTPNRQPLGADNRKPADIARSPIAGCRVAMSLRMRPEAAGVTVWRVTLSPTRPTIYRRSRNPRPSKIAGIAFSIRAVRVADCFAPLK
jgi:hypothetical protein